MTGVATAPRSWICQWGLSIVPTGAALEAHLYGPSRAVGFVRPGQKVLCATRLIPIRSLAMIAGYYGSESDLGDLRRHLAISLKGVNLKDLMSMADRIGFATRPVRLELDELAQLKTPCILHWDLNHFVVLDGISGGRVVVHDPAVGVRRLPLPVVSRHFSGIALELTPVGGFDAVRAGPRLGMRSLLGRMIGVKRTLVQLFLLALAIELFSIVSPLFLQWVVDHALVTADRDLLLTLALGFSLLLLLKVAISAMRGWMLIAIGATMRIYKRTTLRQHIDAKPPGYFRTLVALLERRQQVSLFFAEHEGKRLATALVVYFGRRATYFFGGSLALKRQVMAPYLLHFEIMRRAQARGCEWYDLWGVAPQGHTDDPWQDISVFKRKFGGVEVSFVPTLDYIYDPAAYERYLHTLREPAVA